LFKNASKVFAMHGGNGPRFRLGSNGHCVADLPVTEDGVIRKRSWKQHRQRMAIFVARQVFESIPSQGGKDGDTELAERPKVAGAQAVAAGSNNDDVWQIDRGQKNAMARARAVFGKGGRQRMLRSPARVGEGES
jgi:hypothetical protein